MIVVSDTTALSALLRCGRLPLLQLIFGEMVIPPPVLRELEGLARWGVDLDVLRSAWVRIIAAQPSPLLLQLLSQLDEGEAHAIALSIELEADLLIIDELEGRKAASVLGIPHTGFGGVLVRAKSQGIIPEVRPLLDEAQAQAGFYLNPAVRDLILKNAGEL